MPGAEKSGAYGAFEEIIGKRIEGMALWIEKMPQEVFGMIEKLYHNKDHRFNMTRPASREFVQFVSAEFPEHAKKCNFDRLSAFQNIIGNWHDIVYTHVEKNSHPKAKEILQKYVDFEIGKNNAIKGVKLKAPSMEEAPIINMVFRIFNIIPEQNVNAYNGLNELLTAVVVADIFYNELPERMAMEDIAIIVHAIAGTVAFNDQSYFPNLEKIMMEVRDDFGLNLSNNEIKISSLIAVENANRDVENFFKGGFDIFITNLEGVVAEAMESKKGNDEENYIQASTPDQFVTAFINQINFFNNVVKAENVPHKIHGWPSEEVYQEYTKESGKNIEDGKLYLKAKTVSTSIVTSIATIIGEHDIFLEDMAGDNKPIKYDIKREMDTQEKRVLSALSNKTHNTVGKLFAVGDTPIGEFFFAVAGREEVERLYKMIEEHNKGNFNSKEFAQEFLDEITKIVGANGMRSIIGGLREVSGRKGNDRVMEKLNELYLNSYMNQGYDNSTSIHKWN